MRVEHWQGEKFAKLIIYSHSKADDKAFEKFMERKLITIEITSEVVDCRGKKKAEREGSKK